MEWHVEKLSEDQVDIAGQVLARSFDADPLAVYMLPDEEERRRLLPWHFECVTRYGVLFGDVLTTKEIEGVAIWLRPGELEMTEERVVAARLHEAPSVLGEAAWNRFSTTVGFLEGLHGEDVPEKHWYLMVLGVDPAVQGRGLGSALMQPILSRADAEGRRCYLETSEAANVDFYQRRGFRLVREGREPSSGLDYWTFCRDPR